MKIESLELNITALKDAMGASLKVEDIKKDLIDYGAVVRGYRDEQNRIIMVITGDIDIEDVENAFGVYGVDVNDFIIDEDDYIPNYDDVDDVEVFDNRNARTKRNAFAVNEKKSGCCPKKKNMVNLAEALSGKTKVETAKLDTIIDNITGKHITESIAFNAIKKAKKESTKAYLIEHLDAKKYNMIWESLESGKKSLYENVKINKKSIAEYTKDELVAIREKVLNQISALEGLAEKEEELARKKKLSSILEDEISFRTANAMLSEEDSPSGLEFKDLNPNSTNEDEEKKDNNEDEQNDDAEQNDDTEQNDDAEQNDDPDKDEEVEIGSIIVTLASKQAAEDLAQDLYDAGVPEDAVEIEPVESEDEESSEEENTEDTEEKSEEETTEPAEEEKPEESVKYQGKKVNEADDEEEKTEDDAETEEKSDEDSDDAEAEAEAPHKLILTNTDYVNELADVLENIWGMEHSEFEELIGGEIVSSDDTEDNSDENEEKSDDADDSSDDMDFDPDKIFNDL